MTSVGVWLSISFAPYQIISVGLFLLWAKVSEFSFIHISEIKCFFFKMYFKCSWLLVSVIFNMRFWCRFFFAFTRSRPSDGMTNEIYYDRLLLSPFDSDKCDLCIWLMFHLRFLIIASLLVHGEIKTKCFTYKKKHVYSVISRYRTVLSIVCGFFAFYQHKTIRNMSRNWKCFSKWAKWFIWNEKKKNNKKQFECRLDCASHTVGFFILS